VDLVPGTAVVTLLLLSAAMLAPVVAGVFLAVRLTRRDRT
jgi:hypothetical protein